MSNNKRLRPNDNVAAEPTTRQNLSSFATKRPSGTSSPSRARADSNDDDAHSEMGAEFVPGKVVEWAKTGCMNWAEPEGATTTCSASATATTIPAAGSPDTPSLEDPASVCRASDSTASDNQPSTSAEPLLQDDKLRFSMFPVRWVHWCSC